MIRVLNWLSIYDFLFIVGVIQCVEIIDTSGEYEFPAMIELNIRLSSACILVYDINSEESLNDVVELNKTIKRIKST